MQLPELFIRQILGLGLGDKARTLISALADSAPSVSIRLNESKQGAELAVKAAATRQVPWNQAGWYLGERPKFTFDPALHQGRYYVQDASSMIVGHVLRHLVDSGEAVRYLDACAAPGGKTTAAIDALPEGSLVVANEYDFRRASILRENVAKWGTPNVVVSRGDTARFAALEGFFDIVAVDAPCSGEGMMRKDAQAVAQWSPRLVDECAARQRDIVANLWPALRPGGYLVYSTCTFNRTENEEMVKWIMAEFGAEPVRVPVEPEWGIEQSVDDGVEALRFLPGVTDGEGLFLAVLRKPGDAPASTPRPRGKKKQKTNGKPSPLPSEARKWLTKPEDYALAEGTDGTVEALPKRWLPEVEALTEHLDVTARGVELGVMKGRDLVPSQALAMSAALSQAAFPSVELSLADALAYLRREAVSLPDGTPKGFVLATYQRLPLGFLKNIGNRSNNLYPSAWRILTNQ